MKKVPVEVNKIRAGCKKKVITSHSNQTCDKLARAQSPFYHLSTNCKLGLAFFEQGTILSDVFSTALRTKRKFPFTVLEYSVVLIKEYQFLVVYGSVHEVDP